jgi:hypothetical protein
MDEVARVLQEQDGLIARAQALEAGLTTTQIARALRRREWVPVHPGVYVEHTGPLSWQQRAWAAVLRCWPAALHGRSAMRAHEGPGRRDADESLIHVAVDRHRNLADPTGVRVHRVSHFEERVQWNVGPPRMRYDDTVLDLAAAAADELDLVAVLAHACGVGRTTARRLLTRLDDRPWIEHREFRHAAPRLGLGTEPVRKVRWPGSTCVIRATALCLTALRPRTDPTPGAA